MAQRVEIIIGSNNQTGDRQLETVIAIVSEFIPSFSCWTGFGVWQGTREKCTKVEAFCSDTEWVGQCVRVLIERLDQDAIEVVIDGQERLYWREP